MTDLQTATLTIKDDEPAFRLQELNLQSPGSKGWHRYQIIWVVRSDELVEWRRDLGPAKSFEANQFNLLGGVVHENGRGESFHNVGELMDMADELRNRDELPEVIESDPQDWLQHYHDEADRRKMAASKQSIFGSKFSKMRY